METILKNRWKSPVLRASLLPLMVAMRVSLQVPNSAPSITAMPPPILSRPFLAKIMDIPTVAEED